MANYFLNNRQVIKNIQLNTGTTLSPVWTAIGTNSEVEITTSFEKKDFYVFADAIKRAVVTGVELGLSTTVKIDANNDAIVGVIEQVNALISSGDISVFNTQSIRFSLLDTVAAGVLQYIIYEAPVVMEISELGGAAEDEGDYKIDFTLVGPATAITAPSA